MGRCPRTAEKTRFFLVLGRGRLLPQPSECFLFQRKHSPPCTPVLPFLRELGRRLFYGTAPRPPRAAWGLGANLPRPVAGVMSAPALALRPPFGRPGSPSRPRHAASAARAEGGPCRAAVKAENWRTGELFFLTHVGGSRSRFRAIQRFFRKRQAVWFETHGLFIVNKKSPPIWRAFGHYALSMFYQIPGDRLVLVPGDGCRRERGCVSDASHSPEKSALGKDGGLGGEGNTLCASQGVSFPPTLSLFRFSSLFLPRVFPERRPDGRVLRWPWWIPAWPEPFCRRWC